MLDYPDDLQYTDSHEYVRLKDDMATIGITAFAVDHLGDIVFVDLPEVGTTVEKGNAFATIESVKAVEDIYAPVSGVVVAVNTVLLDAPESLSSDPYTHGWLVEIQMQDASELSDAMSAAEYRSKVEGM